MAAAAAPSWMLVLLLFSGSPLSLPLSLPPLPEDPAIQRMAPEQCLWYLSLAGVDKANPKSNNKVEQLLAEEDVQLFVREVTKQINAAFANAAPNDPLRKALGEEGPKLVETLLSRPMCVYIGSVGVGMNGPVVRGGLAVNLGDAAAATKASLEKVETALLTELGKPASVDAAGWHTVAISPEIPTVQWSVQDKYLLLGLGEGEGQKLNERRLNSKAAPDWLTQLRTQLPVERPAMVHFVNVKSMITLVQLPMAAAMGMDQSQSLLAGLGVKNLKYYGSVNGLDREGYVSRAIMPTEGEPTGLLSLALGEPLTKESLATIPPDASFAVAARVDPEHVIETLISIAAVLDPDLPAEFDQGAAQMAQLAGVHLKDDILDSLGDTWCLYNSPDDGGLVFTGLTLTVSLKDRDKLLQASDRLATISRQAAEQQQRNGESAMAIRDFEYRGQRIFFMNFVSPQSPFSPAWCLTDKQLVVSLFPQAIKSFLDREKKSSDDPAAKKSLADLPTVAALFADGKKPTVISYQDTPGLFKVSYPIAQIVAQFGFSSLQSEGIDLHIGLWPNARSIGPHLVSTLDVVQADKDGIHFQSRGSMPLGIGTVPLVTIAYIGFFTSEAGPMIPFGVNVAPAAGAVDQTNSEDYLRGISQGILTFEDSSHTLPAAFAADKEGKPLLSWRMAILPFIGEEELASQFHLDEPWDSDHNKALIERMPEVYKAPGSKAAAEFKTVYLGVRGDKTVFPGAKPIKLRSVTDGTANTIMVVETADDKAIVWTKPDDFESDDKNPIAGLIGLRDGIFLAAFVDGHVQDIPKDVDPDDLKALFTRNGDEKTDATNLKRSTAAAAK